MESSLPAAGADAANASVTQTASGRTRRCIPNRVLAVADLLREGDWNFIGGLH
jgi:hypothetical protein